MALFQRIPQRQNIIIPYTITNSARKQLLVVGLGNVGRNFTNTRHNIGFSTLDYFAKQNNFDEWKENKKLSGYLTQQTISDTYIILLKPTTLMNLSGDSVKATSNYYKINIKDIVVVYDELSINFGQIRTRKGGHSAGHNGIRSLINCIGSDFERIRIGIKNNSASKQDSSYFVLAKFSKAEIIHLPDLYNEVGTIITERIFSGHLPHDTRSIILG